MKQEVAIARQAGISMGGFAFGQVARFGYSLAAARLLGAEALGIYALVVSIAQVGEVLAALGLDAALLRLANRHEGEERRRVVASALRTGFLAALAVSALLILFSGQIAAALHGGTLLRFTLCSAAAALPVSVVTLLAGHAVQASGNLGPKMVATQVVAPTSLLFFMVSARYLSGVEAALVLPFVPTALLALAWLLPAFARTSGVGPGDLPGAGADRSMLEIALPLLAVSLFGMFSHWIDIMMLGLLTDTRTVGLYQPAARTAGIIRAVLFAFAGIAAPMIAGFHSRGDRNGIRDLYALISRWGLIVALPPVIALAIFPGEALSLFGPGFDEASGAMLLLLLSALLQIWFGLGSTILAMGGQERVSFLNQAGALFLQIVLHLTLIPRYGLDGAALSMLAVTVVLTIVLMVEMRAIFGIPPFVPKLWKPLLAGTLTATALFFSRPWLLTLGPLPAFATGALLGTGLYLLLMLLFRLEAEEKAVILKYIRLSDRKSEEKHL